MYKANVEQVSFRVVGTWKIECLRKLILCLHKHWRQLGKSLVVFFSILAAVKGSVNAASCSFSNVSLTAERQQITWRKKFFVLHLLERDF